MYEKNVSFDALVLFLTTGTIPLLGPTIPLLGLFVIFFGVSKGWPLLLQ